MANGTRWTEQDMLAKGLKADARGIYKFVGKQNVGAIVAGMIAEDGKLLNILKNGKLKVQKQRPAGLIAIENVLRAVGIAYETEYEFHPTRKWRFDIAVPQLMLAIEYEGIYSDKSRHTNLRGYTEDSNKYNAAQLLGWKVLRYTAKNYKNFITDLQQLLTNK